jgi:hypothetical protein
MAEVADVVSWMAEVADVVSTVAEVDPLVEESESAGTVYVLVT